MDIDTTFPGGNAIITSVDGDEISLHPDLRDTEGPWFYWCIRVCGAAGRTLHLHLGAEHCLTVRGPMLSTDGGTTWTWCGEEPGGWATCPIPEDADQVWLGVAPPYTDAHLETFLAPRRADGRIRERELCRSRGGLVVPLFDLGPEDGSEDHQIVLTARHHCCEMQANREIEGIIDAVLADTDNWWSRQRLLIVPFMDRDGVEAGDQGKNRRPHDHNRDYRLGRYPETRALRALVDNLCDQRLAVSLDLHCPWIRGTYNEHIYQPGSMDSAKWSLQQAFARILEEVREGPLPYRADGDLPFGQSWNTTPPGGDHLSCGRWFQAHAPLTCLSSSIEFPYAEVSGVPVMPGDAEAFGRDLARAMQRFLSA